MDRREFIRNISHASLGLSAVSLVGCAVDRRTPAQRKSAVSILTNDLEKQMPELMTGANVPGVSVAIIHEGSIVWRQGFGFSDAGRRVAVGPDTVFEAASMSKPVFAYVALKLCEQGILGLDTPLSRYGAEPLLVGDARFDLITPRMILSHSSGLQNFRSHDEPLKLHFPPGSQYAYSGEGYYYLQSVITHLTGKVDRNDCATFEADLKVCATDIGESLQRRLLAPFDMTRSRYIVDEAITPHLAMGHDENGQPLNKRPASGPAIARYAAMGGLFTTPTDYAKFLIEILRPKDPDDFRLTQASLREMLRPQIRLPDKPRPSSWGLGWQLQENGLFNHGGDHRGFHCHAIASPKTASGVVVMTNGENGWKIIPQLLSRPALAPLLGVPAESL
jgi:CubicO group peptidase (beta-lactamase class C family)